MKNQKSYRQDIFPRGHERKETLNVSVGQYAISHSTKVRTMKTLLGSCVGVIGHHGEHGFLAHVHSHIHAWKMLDGLRQNVLRETGLALEDFHITLTGGHTINPDYDFRPGVANIKAVLEFLGRPPDAKLDLWGSTGNKVEFDLQSGKVISRTIEGVKK